MIYFDLFTRSEQIHADSLKRANRALARLTREPGKDDSIVVEEQLIKQSFRISPEKGFVANSDSSSSNNSVTSRQGAADNAVVQSFNKQQGEMLKQTIKKWQTEVVATLKPGEVFGSVINIEGFWLVARYAGVSKVEKGAHEFTGFLVPKISYGEWLEREKKLIAIVEN